MYSREPVRLLALLTMAANVWDRERVVSAPRETPLDAVAVDPDLVEKLRGLWISSAEQIVATAATPGGIQTLAEGLDASVEDVRDLLAAARDALPPEKAAELEAPIDPAEYGLGALRPPRKPDDPEGR